MIHPHSHLILILLLCLVLLLIVVSPTAALFFAAAARNNNNAPSKNKSFFLLAAHSSPTSFGGSQAHDDQDNKENPATACTDIPPHLIVDDFQELPANFPRRDKILVALQAVRKAVRIIQPLQPPPPQAAAVAVVIGASDDNNDNTVVSSSFLPTIAKSDLSPVTVADFAAQAVILHHLHQHFSSSLVVESNNDDNNTSYIAEESSQALQENPALADRVRQVTQMESMDLVRQSIDLGKQYEKQQQQKGQPKNRMNDNNNNNNNDGDKSILPEVWCLDPIDGTKGFLRGEQYCIALALIQDGVPVVGILACPNLPQHDTNVVPPSGRSNQKSNNSTKNNSKRGCIFVASQGGGCYQLPLFPSNDFETCSQLVQKLHVTLSDATNSTPAIKGRFCLGVETTFGDAAGYTMPMVQKIHNGNDSHFHLLEDESAIVIRMDSQAKFGVIARGDAEYYVRLPPAGYQEWIWDIAAGYVVLTEAGGVLTDTAGRAIDFSQGAKLPATVQGILGSNGGKFHNALVQAYQQVKESTEQK